MADGRGNSGYDAGSAPPQKHSALVTGLAAAQNADGGWPYHKGASWTEPTVLALLALGPDHPACASGLAWLRSRQMSDGGWPPQAGVDESTWVTSLVAMLPAPALGPERLNRAVGWILGQMGTNSTFWFRLRERLMGTDGAERNPGWPWFPGTAAWVTPTALALAALSKLTKHGASAEIQHRIGQGRRFLLTRRCADGGWNHGSSHALGYEGNSYPETTGAALLALKGVPGLDKSIAAARKHWRECRSAEAAAWLKLGLLAHEIRTEGWPAPLQPRNVRDTALCVLADRAEQGSNAFID